MLLFTFANWTLNCSTIQFTEKDGLVWMRSPVVNVGHLWSNIDVWKAAGELCLNPIAPNTILEHRRYIIYD